MVWCLAIVLFIILVPRLCQALQIFEVFLIYLKLQKLVAFR